MPVSAERQSAASRADSGGYLSAAIVGDSARYRLWREDKLRRARRCLALPPVAIADPENLTAAELSALRERVAAVNFALYRIDVGGAAAAPSASSAFNRDAHAALKQLCRQVGLARLAANPFAESSGISEICAAESAEAADAAKAGESTESAESTESEETAASAATKAAAQPRRAYIPYTDRALDWHTDGYYHAPGRAIRAFALHTMRAAPGDVGGENQLMDHEILYLLLRDRDPALAACLFADDVLTVPPGTAAGGGARAAQTGPVFWFADGRLQMRFTLRRRNIRWKESPQVRAALAEIRAILGAADLPLKLTRRLRAGEGVLSNNTLHNRAAFAAPAGRPGRLVLRARFYDCIEIAH